MGMVWVLGKIIHGKKAQHKGCAPGEGVQAVKEGAAMLIGTFHPLPVQPPDFTTKIYTVLFRLMSSCNRPWGWWAGHSRAGR